MAFTKIVGAGIHTLSNVHTHNINSSGIITATQFVGPFDGSSGDFSGNVSIGGSLTVNGDFTTLNTTLREVELLRVDANSSAAAGIITQTGAGDLLRLYDGASQVVTVDDTGNVGLGSAVPGALLNLASANPLIRLTDTDSNVHSAIGGESGFLYLYTNSSSRDIIFRGSQEVARLTGDGKLGIGTNVDETQKLTIHGESNYHAGIKLRQAGVSQFRIMAEGGTGNVYYDVYGVGGSGTGDHIFRTKLSTGSLQTMIINEDGKVGIGSEAPTKQFQVKDYTATSTTARNNTVARFISNASNADCNIQLSNGVDHSAQIGIIGDGAEVYFAQDGVEKMRLDSQGRLGIGTDNPTKTLQVMGTILKTRSDSGIGLIYLQNDASHNGQIVVNNSGGTTRLKLDSAGVSYFNGGNVGIVTTVPQSKLELDGRFRILDNSDGTPTSGKGLEISYYTSDDMADILSYDRGGGSYKKLQLRGSSIELKKNNTVLCNVGTGGNGITVGFSTTTNLATNAEAVAVRGYSSFKSTSASYAAIYTNNELNGTDVLTPHILFNNVGANRGGFGYHTDNNSLIMANHTNIIFKTGATQLNGDERLRITSDGDVQVGSFTIVDTRNEGGIHIQPNHGISFRAYGSASGSRNWRIRNDDSAWGNLDFTVGDDNSTDIGSGAADTVLSLAANHNVGINQINPTAQLQIGAPNSATGVLRADPNYFSIDSGYVAGGSQSGVVGSATTAALIFGGDGNTGLYHSASDTLNFTTGGTERLRINSYGQITTRGATGTTFNNVGSNDFGSFLVVNGGHTTNQFGILSLEGNADGHGQGVGHIQFINQANGNGSSGSNVQSRLIARIDSYTETSDTNANDDSGGTLRFFTKEEGVAPKERLTIKGNGRIGINETTPDRDLQVQNQDGVANGGTIRLVNRSTSMSNGQIAGLIEFEQRDSNTPGVSATIRSEMQDTTNGNCMLAFQTGTPSTIGTRLIMHGAGTITVPQGPTQFPDGTTASALVNTSGRQPNSGNDFQTGGSSNKAVGWYTIAVSNGGRSWGRIGIRDTASSRHQAVTLFCGHHYGGASNQNSIHAISSGRHSGNPLGAVRIKAYGTYDGAMLQVYLRDSTNGCQAFLLGDNIQTHGWLMKDWVADGTDPGDLQNFANINAYGYTSAYSDLNQIQAGGTSTDGHIIPGRDDVTDLGAPSYKFDDIFATNTTIQSSSDERLKQDIAALTTAEMNAAKRMSALFKTYRWKSRVSEKGDKARTHTGVIAQQVKAALEAEGLDPTKYGFYGFDEWYEDSEGTKLPIDTPTRQGDSQDPTVENNIEGLGGSIVVPDGFEKKSLYSIRIGELLAFIAAYNEQRFTSIESRLSALESS